MQYTTHYNLNLPEGTDIVNPLVQDNPNYSAIDAAMFANKQAVIGTATEVVSGTVHAITRLNTDSDYFKFTATGNWNTGDSMSVDGTAVSVYLSDGTAPGTGAYIINSEVLALLNGSRVTLIVSSGAVAANAVSYDNSGSGLTATNVQDAIDEIESIINPGSVSVTADGVKTLGDLLNDLFSLVNMSKVTINTKLTTNSGVGVFTLTVKEPTMLTFHGGNVQYLNRIELKSNNSRFMRFQYSNGDNTDYSTNVRPDGEIISIIY